MQTEAIDKEFYIYSPSEMVEEAEVLEKVLKVTGWSHLLERYLNYKKVANLDKNGEIRAVIEGKTKLYEKYRAMFDTFRRNKLLRKHD